MTLYDVLGRHRDYLIAVQKGEIPGASMVHKFGRNDAVPNGIWAHVNLLGSASWRLQAPTTARIKAGGNIADTADGAGARSVVIQGLDSAFRSTTEEVVTNGANASLETSTSWWRIFRAWVSGVGTYGGANVGDIVIENGGGGTDLIKIAAGEGQTQFSAYSIPDGFTGYLLGIHLHVDTNKSSNVRLFVVEDFDTIAAPMKPRRLKLFFDGLINSGAHLPDGPELILPAKSDLWFEAQGDGAVSQVSCHFELLLVDDLA